MTSGNGDMTECPACLGATEPYMEKLASGSTWRVRRCRTCGYGFVSNRPRLEYLAHFYSSQGEARGKGHDTLTEEELRSSLEPRRLARFIASTTPKRGRTLDVGAGSGVLSYHLHARGFDSHLLIDFDDRGRNVLPFLPNAEFRTAAFESVSGQDGPFSLVAMSHVLEHAIDPESWIARAAELLEPRGVLAVALPNFGGVYRLLGRRDPFITPPEHLNFFTPEALRKMTARHGLSVVSVRSRSHVSPTRANQSKPPLPSRMARAAWNATSSVLDRTPLGVDLWFACARG